jgi:glycosyltransferase involved in cell wall biosynthesis
MNLRDITVVVPTRNEVQNVKYFLESLPAEVHLIAVDSSSDETAALITRLRPVRTRVLRSTVNVTHARQMGAEAACTPWLLFTDIDITFAPGYFSILEDCQVGEALYGPKYSSGQEFNRFYHWFARGQQALDALGIPAVSGSNLLVRWGAFMRVGGFDLDLPCNEDSEMGWRLGRAGYDIHYRSDLVVFAHDHRRLRRGVSFKLIHTLVRCVFLYNGLLPRRLRRHDWGYWREGSPR